MELRHREVGGLATGTQLSYPWSCTGRHAVRGLVVFPAGSLVAGHLCEPAFSPIKWGSHYPHDRVGVAMKCCCTRKRPPTNGYPSIRTNQVDEKTTAPRRQVTCQRQLAGGQQGQKHSQPSPEGSGSFYSNFNRQLEVGTSPRNVVNSAAVLF